MPATVTLYVVLVPTSHDRAPEPQLRVTLHWGRAPDVPAISGFCQPTFGPRIRRPENAVRVWVKVWLRADRRIARRGFDVSAVAMACVSFSSSVPVNESSAISSPLSVVAAFAWLGAAATAPVVTAAETASRLSMVRRVDMHLLGKARWRFGTGRGLRRRRTSLSPCRDRTTGIARTERLCRERQTQAGVQAGWALIRFERNTGPWTGTKREAGNFLTALRRFLGLRGSGRGVAHAPGRAVWRGVSPDGLDRE